MDPLADHPNQLRMSPYSSMWNNPVLLTDPDGRCPDCPDPSTAQEGDTANPDGNMEFTLENGEWLGDGGTMEEFTVNASDSDNTSDSDEVQQNGRMSSASSSVGESADYLLGKLYWHNQFGGRSDYNIDASTMDFSGTSQRELNLTGMKVGDSRGVNLFNSGINSNSLAFGKITVTYQDSNQFSITSNKFDFDYQSNSSFGRNAGTFIGGAAFGQFYTIPVTPFSIMRGVSGFGGSYMINFNGTTTIPK